jgi:Trypsin
MFRLFKARLARSLVFTARIRAVRIPPPDTIPSGPAAISGWGAVSNGIGSGPVDILQKAMFTIVTNEVCRAAFDDLNRNSSLVDAAKFCTGPMTGGKLAATF